jgi:predicted ester cyclase
MRREARGATLSPTLFHTNPRRDLTMGEALDLLREGLARNDANDLDGFVGMMAADVEWVTPEGPIHGRDGVREYVGRFREAFPDGRHTIERAVESGSTVAVEGHWTGTHTGAFATPQGDVPPTGQTVTMTFALFVDGDLDARQCRRAGIYMDHMGLAAQLGLIPEPQATGAVS